MHDPEGPDADRDDDPEGAIHSGEPDSRSEVDAATSARKSDVEDDVAAAEARAEAARARLARLRRAAEGGDSADDDAQSVALAEDVERHPAKSFRTRLRSLRRYRPSRRLRRPAGKTVAVGVGVVLAAASLGASGYMLQQHRAIAHKRQLSAEYAAAARQAVTTFMSIDTNHAKDDIQRIIDASTGTLKDQISAMSGLMLKQAEESKTVTKVNVEAVAVESPTDTAAVALVVAKTDVTDAENKNRPPQLWRLSVDLVREGGQYKMSKVDFLQ